MSKQPDPVTQDYQFNHTMLRVRDPKVSLEFYTQILGMEVFSLFSGHGKRRHRSSKG